MEQVALVLLGAALTSVGVLVRNLAARDTHASNRVLELRLEALQDIWSSYNDALWVFEAAKQPGQERWVQSHGEEADAKREAFSREIGRHQILLDRDIIEAFRKLDSALIGFRDGDYQHDSRHPISFPQFQREQLKPRYAELTAAVNKAMGETTHRVKLSLP